MSVICPVTNQDCIRECKQAGDFCAQPSGYELAKYDLTNSDEMVSLGKEIGKEWAESLMPLVKAMPMEQRVIFYSALFAAPFGHCCAAIGWEATHAVLDTMKLMTHGIGERNQVQQ